MPTSDLSKNPARTQEEIDPRSRHEPAAQTPAQQAAQAQEADRPARRRRGKKATEEAQAASRRRGTNAAEESGTASGTGRESGTGTRKRSRASTRTSRSDSLQTFFDKVYLPHIRARKRSWAVDEGIAARHILPRFGKRCLAGIERREVEVWLYDLLNQGLAPATCNRILAVFKTICSLAVRQGVLVQSKSPGLGVDNLKVHNQRERYLTQEEAGRLLQALVTSPCLEARALHLLLLTGARKSEILKARWEYVLFEQKQLCVPLAKSGRSRYILLSNEALAILSALPRTPGCPWVFPARRKNKPLADIFPFWKKLREELGIADVRIHDLRHTFASYLVNCGHSLYEVQRLLGHGDPRTTTRYAHLGQQALLEATQSVSATMADAISAQRKAASGTAAGQQPEGQVRKACFARRSHRPLRAGVHRVLRTAPDTGHNQGSSQGARPATGAGRRVRGTLGRRGKGSL